MSEQVVGVGTTFTLPTNTFTRSGYIFGGWATTSDGSKVFDDGQSVINIGEAGSTVTLYAVWDKDPISDWSYSTNSSTNTITLNKYIGSSTDVTVKNAYTVNGTTYYNVVLASSNGSKTKAPFYGTSVSKIFFEDNVVLPSNCAYLFSNSSFTNIDLSGADSSNVTLMSSMFESATNLTKLNLSNFNTSNVTSMDSMFNYCTSIPSIVLGTGWSKMPSRNIFSGWTSAQTIYVLGKSSEADFTEVVSGWKGSQVTVVYQP